MCVNTYFYVGKYDVAGQLYFSFFTWDMQCLLAISFVRILFPSFTCTHIDFSTPLVNALPTFLSASISKVPYIFEVFHWQV